MNEKEVEAEIQKLTRKKNDLDRCSRAQREASNIRSKLQNHYYKESREVEKALDRLKSTNKWSECVLKSWSRANLEKSLLKLINETSEAEKYNFDKQDIMNYKRTIQDIRSYCYQLQKHLDSRIVQQEKFESQ